MARKRAKPYTEEEAKQHFGYGILAEVVWQGQSITPNAKKLAQRDKHIMAECEDGTILVLKPSD